MGGEGRGASPSQSGWELGGERSEGTTPIFHLFVNSFDFVYITLEELTILPLSFSLGKSLPKSSHQDRGGLPPIRNEQGRS